MTASDWTYIGATDGGGSLFMAPQGTPPPRYWIAQCTACEPPLPMPFVSDAERDAWAAAHEQATAHDVQRFRED